MGSAASGSSAQGGISTYVGAEPSKVNPWIIGGIAAVVLVLIVSLAFKK